MLARLALLAFLAPALVLAPSSAAPASGHVPQLHDALAFSETISVLGGYGNYSGYTETDTLTGTLNVTAVLPDGNDTVAYNYTGHYANSQGLSYPWTSKGTFTFSARTFDYVQGTDNQTGASGEGVWFLMNRSLSVGGTFEPLGTSLTVDSLGVSYLDPATHEAAKAIYADGTGRYLRDDAYGRFNASYDWQAFFDPSTGYILGEDYAEIDADGHGDGFVYTDTLEVTKTSFPLTASAPPTRYAVDFPESGLASGAVWTLTFDGTPRSGTGTIEVPDVTNGTYLYGANASGYTAAPTVDFLAVNGATTAPTVVFASSSSSPGNAALLYALVAVVVVIVLVLLLYALVRRARRAHPLPRHSAGGRPNYAPPPPGPAPPPISLAPSDQPWIQQVVVKEVVKVNCRYCGSLIDSTAETCPFCGATRT